MALGEAYELRWPVYPQYRIEKPSADSSSPAAREAYWEGGYIYALGERPKRVYKPLSEAKDLPEAVARLVRPDALTSGKHGISEAALLRFVSTYGLLGVDIGWDGVSRLPGDSVYFARKAVLRVWQLLEMWDAVQRAREAVFEGLDRWVEPEPPLRVRELSPRAPTGSDPDGVSVRQIAVRGGEHLGRRPSGADKIGAAMWYIHRELNGALREGVRAALGPRRISAETRLHLTYACRRLIDAVYLELAHLIASEGRTRRCAVCGGLMMGRADKRAHVECGTRERMRRYRQRRAAQRGGDNVGEEA